MKRVLVFVEMLMLIITLRIILSSAIRLVREKDSNIFLFTFNKYILYVIIVLIISIV